jgi:hypothetical protein
MKETVSTLKKASVFLWVFEWKKEQRVIVMSNIQSGSRKYFDQQTSLPYESWKYDMWCRFLKLNLNSKKKYFTMKTFEFIKTQEL